MLDLRCLSIGKKCFLCQDHEDEKVIDPRRSTRSSCVSGYESLSVNILAFHELEAMPIKLSEDLLGTQQGLQNILSKNCAVWHKQCVNKCSTLKLNRVKEQKVRSLELAQKKTRQSFDASARIGIVGDNNKVCFLCDEGGGILHKVATMAVDSYVRNCAAELSDVKLSAKLAAGDLHALDAVYHKNCMSGLFNRYKQHVNRCNYLYPENSNESIALAELVAYIETRAENIDDFAFFKLADLAKLYKTRLEQLGVYVPECFNATRLKERILQQCPALHVSKKGQDVILAFGDDIGAAIHYANENSRDSHAIYLTNAAQIIRKEVLSKKQSFNGRFSQNCQEEAVAYMLLTFINMIIDGHSIND